MKRQYCVLCGVIYLSGTLALLSWVFGPIAHTAAYYALSASAQVAITAVAVIAATAAIVLSRQDMGNSEAAFRAVLHAPGTLMTFGLLLAAVGIALFGILMVTEPGTSALSFLATIPVVVSVSSTLAGLGSAVVWLYKARNTISSVAILAALVDEIPDTWTAEANEFANEWWKREFNRAGTSGYRLPLLPNDAHLGTLSPTDPMTIAIDALATWIERYGARPVSADAARLLSSLREKLKGANEFLTGHLMTVHLSLLVQGAIRTNSPPIIITVIEFIEVLHEEWEQDGDATVRANHNNWLLRELLPWCERRDCDYPSMQVLMTTFRANAKEIYNQKNAMSIALPFYIGLIVRLVERERVDAAFNVWLAVDQWFRRHGPETSDYERTLLLRVLTDASQTNLELMSLGLFADWIATSLLHAAAEAEKRGRKEWGDVLRKEIADTYGRLGRTPMWQGKPISIDNFPSA